MILLQCTLFSVKKKLICLPSEKGVFSNRKEFASLLEWTPFQKEFGVRESKKEVIKIVSLVKNLGKSTRYIQSH